jgi:hypothetical protein
MTKDLFIDFWKDNPFRELEFEIPPVPSGNEIADRVRKRGATIRSELDALNGQTSPEAKERTKALEAEKARLDELRKELIKKADQMRKNIPFDTLLSVQSPAPPVFTKPALRSAVAARLWLEIAASDGTFPLSDTDRSDFEADLKTCRRLHGRPEIVNKKSKGAKAK